MEIFCIHRPYVLLLEREVDKHDNDQSIKILNASDFFC
jgi:hypothetical protein